MTITLGSNIASLGAQRQLGKATEELAKVSERLSSGMRINHASDDAAGLAVASSLTSSRRVFDQGVRNLNDGISVLNIADGALNELTNVVTRIQELAEQSANGTYSNKQRSALDTEAQALSKEYFRIAKSTEFNGIKILDGGSADISLQAGYGASGSLAVSTGGQIGTGDFETNTDYATPNTADAVVLGDLNGDGILDMISANDTGNSASVYLGRGDGTFGSRKDFVTGAKSFSVSVGDMNNDGALDVLSANYDDNTVSVLLGNGDGSLKAKMDFNCGQTPMFASPADLNGDGILDIATANWGTVTVSALLGNGDGTFKAYKDYAGAGSRPRAVAVSDLNGDGVMDMATAGGSVTACVYIGNGDGSFNRSAAYYSGSRVYDVDVGDVNRDGIPDLVTANQLSSTVAVLLGNGDGTFKINISFSGSPNTRSVALGDLNGDGLLDIVSGSYTNSASVLLGNGDGTFSARSDLPTGKINCWIALGDLNQDGVLDLASADYTDTGLSVLLGETRSGVAPLLPFSLKSRADSKWALELMKQKQTQLGAQRSTIGAYQSRIAIATSNLSSMSLNYAAAASRITDADVAADSATLVRQQILQQAATAILAQANQQPSLALTLLKG